MTSQEVFTYLSGYYAEAMRKAYDATFGKTSKDKELQGYGAWDKTFRGYREDNLWTLFDGVMCGGKERLMLSDKGGRNVYAYNGKWTYGDLFHIDGKTAICPTDDINWMDGSELESSKWCWVDPYTIGQFTSLCDANGRELYDGDIFTVNNRYPKLIEFRQDHAAFCMANISDLDKVYFYPWQQIRPAGGKTSLGKLLS